MQVSHGSVINGLSNNNYLALLIFYATTYTTGANKGIGLEIVKGLLKSERNFVYLGSRDLGRGVAALDSLGPEVKGRVEVLQLDVTSADSIASAATTLREKLGPESLQVRELLCGCVVV